MIIDPKAHADALESHVSRWMVWLVNLIAFLLLGILRADTGPEFAFASITILPILITAWLYGKSDGFAASLLAASIWVVSDIVLHRQFSSLWIPWINALTRFLTYGLIATLAAELRLLLAKEQEHARRDKLTGLLNRRAFLEIGDRETIRARRYKHSLAVVFLDLDHFKKLNDTRGHHAGDAALETTARALQATLRSSDWVARLGGDEFAVLLPEINYAAAVETGRKISAAVSTALRNFSPATASVGLAWFEKSELEFHSMVEAADKLMYEVKQHSKGEVLVRRN